MTEEDVKKRKIEVKMGSIKVAKYYPGKHQPVTKGYQNVLIHTVTLCVAQ